MKKPDEFKEAREDMVVGLVKQDYLRTERIIRAFSEIPRHLFVNRGDIPFAYADHPIRTRSGQTISAPHMVAMMTELLKPMKTDKVLEIGGGSGYQAAILSKLVKKVYSVEYDAGLVDFAKKNLEDAGVENVETIHGDGSKGYEKAKPYHKIIVTCASPRIFDAWTGQLRTGGILLAPLGTGTYQELTSIKKTKDGLKERNHGGCVFVPLRTWS